MSGFKNPKHGRDHLPGGWDAIPFFPDGFTPNQSLPVHTFAQSGVYDGTWADVVFDETIYPGAVLRNSPAADGDFFVFHCLLGPFGSLWVVDVILETGPDYGIVSMAMATVSEDSVSDPTNKGRMQDPSTCTYVAGIGSQDCYSAGYAPNQKVAGLGELRVIGTPGAPLTTLGTDLDGNQTGDGGPGLYNLKVYIDGQNGASGGFKGGIQALALRRIAEGFD